MRAFWAVIGLLLVAAAVAFWPNEGKMEAPSRPVVVVEQPSPAPVTPAQDAPAAPGGSGTALEPIPTPADTGGEELAFDAEALNKVLGIEDEQEAANQEVEEALANDSPATVAQPVEAAMAEEPASEEPVLVDGPPLPDPAPPAQEPAPAPPSEGVAGNTAGAPPTEASVPPAQVDETPIPVEVAEQDDGTLLVDGKYIVKGSGTAEDPYVVPWEMLLTAQQTYAPRLGKKRLPERITMFSGKIVRVTGYISFPLMEEEPKDLLAMLNMWDGCCIGIPPTPYDAIEVKLRTRITGDDRFARYGTLTGKFGVEPHLVGQWLVGLYVMDDATLDTKEFGGFGS